MAKSPQPAYLPKDEVPATYTWIAPFHDLLALLVETRARRQGLSWARVRDGEHLLEVGVGTGLTFQHLLEQNPNGWTEGIDRTPAMLRRARKRAARSGTSRYCLRRGDAYALPFANHSFDLIWSSYMIDMLPLTDFEPVLKEFRRVLQPGGRVVLVSETKGRRWYNQFWELLYRFHPPLMGGCRGVTLAPAVQAAGFRKVRRTYVSQWSFPSEVVYGEK